MPRSACVCVRLPLQEADFGVAHHFLTNLLSFLRGCCWVDGKVKEVNGLSERGRERENATPLFLAVCFLYDENEKSFLLFLKYYCYYTLNSLTEIYLLLLYTCVCACVRWLYLYFVCVWWESKCIGGFALPHFLLYSNILRNKVICI